MKYNYFFLVAGLALGACQSETAPEHTAIIKDTIIGTAPAPETPVAPTGSTEADSSAYSAAIKAEAKKMNDCLMKGDFKGYAKFMHPRLIKKLGGEQKMIEAMKSGFQQIKEKGSFLSKITVNEPSPALSINKELQAVLPQTVELKVPQGIMVTQSVLVALSKDGGNHWCFIDTDGRDLAMMQKEFPELSSKLVFPKRENPKLIRELK